MAFLIYDVVLACFDAGKTMESVSVPGRSMWHQISVESDYLRAELFGRQTALETREFLRALEAYGVERQQPRILISVRCSKPVFTVEKYGIVEYFDRASRYSAKIALLGDSDELRIAHQYIESLARQRGVNVRAFRDEAVALKWLRAIEPITT